MSGELRKVCSARPVARTQNSYSKGHEHWRKDTWHIAPAGSDKTWCGRDCADYLDMGEAADDDLSNPHLCNQCKRVAADA